MARTVLDDGSLRLVYRRPAGGPTTGSIRELIAVVTEYDDVFVLAGHPAP